MSSYTRPCRMCHKPAVVHVVKSNTNPPTEELYCEEHAIQAGSVPPDFNTCSIAAASAKREAKLLQVLNETGCPAEAIDFILKSLDTICPRHDAVPTHATAQQLCAAFQTLALKQLGNEATKI